MEHRYHRCPECGRRFDLMSDDDATEFFYGHDCDPDVAATYREEELKSPFRSG